MQRRKAKATPKSNPLKTYKSAVEAQIASQQRLRKAETELREATNHAQECDKVLSSSRAALLDHASNGLRPTNSFYNC